MAERPRVHRHLAATAILLIASIGGPTAASSPSPGTGGDPGATIASSSPGATAAALPTAFTWEPLALPKRNVNELPWMVIGAIPGERTVMRAYWSDIGHNFVVRESKLWTTGDAATWAAGKDGGPWVGGHHWIMGGHRPNVSPAWLATGDGAHVMAFDGELRASPDGQRWSAVKWPKKLKDRFWDVAGVVTTPAGFLATGMMLDAALEKDGQLHAAAFTSQDGRTWQAEPIAPAPSGATQGLAAAPDGTVVGLGSTGSDDARETVLWIRTPDGAWSSIPQPWAQVSGNPVQLGHAAGRFYAQVVTREEVDGKTTVASTLWTSPDGLAWEPGPTTGLLEPTRLVMATGAIDGGVLVVTNPVEPGPKIARWSPDWETWTESTIPGLDDHSIDTVIGRLHDGRPVLMTMAPDRRSKTNGLSIMDAMVGTPVP